MTPEQLARRDIDAALESAGWIVQDFDNLNLHAGRGIAVREVVLNRGHGTADYLLFVDQRAVGVVEAKKQGMALTGVVPQAGRYGAGLPSFLSAPVRPLPFLYASTGIETLFTNQMDPDPASHGVFHFHRPETLMEWVHPRPVASDAVGAVVETPVGYGELSSLRGRLRAMPPIVPTGLWPAQLQAIENLEKSFALGRQRALIQMATGSGKTFTAVSSIYRLIKHAGARRVLFLVDRGNLGRQALKEFQAYRPPDDGRTFTELYVVDHLKTNRMDPTAKVVITTIQRLYSMLRGEADLAADLDEQSAFETLAALARRPDPIAYNPAIPIEQFDIIFSDECHRSIYNLWAQVLQYFDGFLVGLTATPSKQTFGFFEQNIVMEYNHAAAVLDNVNVDYDQYNIRTRITGHGSTVEAGYSVARRDRATRKMRLETLEDDLTYDASALDRSVVAQDQIRTIVRTFRDRLFTEIFPGRSIVPKTLIFAKDDSHADEIVQIVRQEFGKGNDFAEKITYRAEAPEKALAAFRNSYNPRIVVTVDMIATGTDVKPLECVVFMRTVKSKNYFEQMKGRGVRVINDNDLRAVSNDATSKTRFVLVDCVGVTEQNFTDSPSLERAPTVALDKLLNAVGLGSVDPDILSTLAGRLARLQHTLPKNDTSALAQLTGGKTLGDIAADIVAALDPDRQVEAAREANGLAADADPTEAQIAATEQTLLAQAAVPLASNPVLRQKIVELKSRSEQTIDTVSQDAVIEAAFAGDAKQKAQAIVSSFEQYLADNRDEITALQVLYAQPYAYRVNFRDLRSLADAIQQPPRNWTPELLWKAYEKLDASKVRGSPQRVLTNLVSLVRFALHKDSELVPFPDQVQTRFDAWLAQQRGLGRTFNPEQLRWLQLIRDHVGGSLRIDNDAFEDPPFKQEGGLGRVYQVFGDGLSGLLDELNEVLAA